MALSRCIEILPMRGTMKGETLFSAPQSSNETLIAEVYGQRQTQLFCHRRQTDQLLVLRGVLDLVVLQERSLRCLRLREDEATWVRIPPGVPHGAINRGRTPALVVNAVLRHGPSDPRDYQPRRLPPFLENAWAELVSS